MPEMHATVCTVVAKLRFGAGAAEIKFGGADRRRCAGVAARRGSGAHDEGVHSGDDPAPACDRRAGRDKADPVGSQDTQIRRSRGAEQCDEAGVQNAPGVFGGRRSPDEQVLGPGLAPRQAEARSLT